MSEVASIIMSPSSVVNLVVSNYFVGVASLELLSPANSSSSSKEVDCAGLGKLALMIPVRGAEHKIVVDFFSGGGSSAAPKDM